MASNPHLYKNKRGCSGGWLWLEYKAFLPTTTRVLSKGSFGTNGYRKCRLFPAFTSHCFRLQQDVEPNRPQCTLCTTQKTEYKVDKLYFTCKSTRMYRGSVYDPPVGAFLSVLLLRIFELLLWSPQTFFCP